MGICTRVGFVRHGTTEWNREKRIQGATDVPLNGEGVREARLLAERLKEESWDVIYSSDLSRAYETARIIAGAMNRTVEGTEPGLREKQFGEAEGTTEEERIRRWGESWRSKIRGAETDEEVFRRGKEALDLLLERHPGQNILIVSHGAWIVCMLTRLLPDVELPYIGNTSVSVLEHRDGQWHPVLLGCQKHLDELP